MYCLYWFESQISDCQPLLWCFEILVMDIYGVKTIFICAQAEGQP